MKHPLTHCLHRLRSAGLKLGPPLAVPTIAINIAVLARADTRNFDSGPTSSRISIGDTSMLRLFPRPPESDYVEAEQQECGRVHAGIAGGTGSGLVYHIPIHAASGPQLLCVKSQDKELECLRALEKAMAKGRVTSFACNSTHTVESVNSLKASRFTVKKKGAYRFFFFHWFHPYSARGLSRSVLKRKMMSLRMHTKRRRNFRKFSKIVPVRLTSSRHRL